MKPNPNWLIVMLVGIALVLLVLVFPLVAGVLASPSGGPSLGPNAAPNAESTAASSSNLLYRHDFNPEIILPSLLILSVAVLLIIIALIVIEFHVFGLTDGHQPLGLPKGSVQSIIALSLIMIFVIMSVFLVSRLQQTNVNANSVDLSKQVLTMVGTLLVTVVGFYFGSRSAASTDVAGARSKGLLVSNFFPQEGQKGRKFTMYVSGSNFTPQTGLELRPPPGVKAEVIKPNMKYFISAEQIAGQFDLAQSVPGVWSLAVINPDKSEVVLPGVFKITEEPAVAGS